MKIMVFDVGGTEIKYSVMDEQMHRTDSGAVPTPQDTQAQFLDAVYRLYAPHKDEVSGIAMALPGFVDNRTGYVSNGGALLYNTATPVGQLLAEKCGCPVILENDGKAAAMAELANGALKDCCNAAVFIIGTGVGGGVLRDVCCMERPYIFTKHIYACASLVGAAVCRALWPLGMGLAMLAGCGVTVVIRICAATFRWSFPKA